MLQQRGLCRGDVLYCFVLLTEHFPSCLIYILVVAGLVVQDDSVPLQTFEDAGVDIQLTELRIHSQSGEGISNFRVAFPCIPCRLFPLPKEAGNRITA